MNYNSLNKDKYYYIISNEQLELFIKVDKVLLFPKIILLILSFIGIIIPMIILLYFSNNIKPGFIISIIIFFVTSFFFIRLLLWNIYGKEVYIIKKDSIIILNDYKFFKEKVLEINFFKSVVISTIDNNDLHSYFSIMVNNKIHQSSILLEKKYVFDIVDKTNIFLKALEH